MNKGIIYCTKIREEYEGAHMEHMIAEKLLEIALKKEYGINLYNEPRAEGVHGAPGAGNPQPDRREADFLH